MCEKIRNLLSDPVNNLKLKIELHKFECDIINYLTPLYIEPIYYVRCPLTRPLSRDGGRSKNLGGTIIINFLFLFLFCLLYCQEAQCVDSGACAPPHPPSSNGPAIHNHVQASRPKRVDLPKAFNKERLNKGTCSTYNVILDRYTYLLWVL